MVFNDTTFIETTATEELPKHFGAYKKPRYSGGEFRSNMMINPLRLRHINRIDESGADVITLNLEDAIAKERKREALYKIALFLSHLQASKSCIVVRVNPLDEGGAEEIKFLNGFGFDAVRVSKVKTAGDIERALRLLSDDKELHISMETKEAFADLTSLRIDERFTTANIGILDLLHSLSLPQSLLKLKNPTIEYILSKFLVDSSTIGLRAFSFMYQDYLNVEEFEQWCLKERAMGFSSKATMGPKQTEIANRVFGVDPKELERARSIVELFEVSSAKGENGFLHEQYGFIDEPIYKDAKLVLERR
jgi:citrate lyase subunit beta/citryl-CoA lyase